MVVLPEFCAEWHRYAGQPDAVRRSYVSEELRRLDALGAPLLTVVVAHLTDDRVQQTALERIEHNDDGEGRPIFEPREWRLRLVEGGKPPLSDAQGRPLSEADAGKVLLAKVGVLGGQLGTEADPQEIRQWGADAREGRDRMGRDLYRYVRITRAGTSLSLADAIAVLRQWGVGVAKRQRRRSSEWRPGQRDDGTGQLNWLVEEVVPQRARIDDDAPRPAPRKAAA